MRDRPLVPLCLLLAPLGAFVYMAFLNWWIGDGLAFIHVQRAWARAYGSPVTFVWDALTDWPKTGFVPTAAQQLAVAVITGFVLAGLLLVFPSLIEAIVEWLIGRDISYTYAPGLVIGLGVLLWQARTRTPPKPALSN